MPTAGCPGACSRAPVAGHLWPGIYGRSIPVDDRARGSVRCAAEPDVLPRAPPAPGCSSRHLPLQTWSLQRWSLQAWNLQTPDLQTWDLQTWSPQAWNLQVQKTEERPGPSAARLARRAPPGARLGAGAGNTAKSGALAPQRWRSRRRWPGGLISCRSGWRALAPPTSTSPTPRPGR